MFCPSHIELTLPPIRRSRIGFCRFYGTNYFFFSLIFRHGSHNKVTVFSEKLGSFLFSLLPKRQEVTSLRCKAENKLILLFFEFSSWVELAPLFGTSRWWHEAFSPLLCSDLQLGVLQFPFALPRLDGQPMD